MLPVTFGRLSISEVSPFVVSSLSSLGSSRGGGVFFISIGHSSCQLCHRLGGIGIVFSFVPQGW